VSLEALLVQVASVVRPTSTLVDGLTLPFTQALNLGDSQGLFVKLQGLALTSGITVSIAGVSGGTTSTEVVSLGVGNVTQRSDKRWTSLTQIASLSASAGKVMGDAVYGSGQPAPTAVVVDAAQRGRLQLRETPNQGLRDVGSLLLEEWLWFTKAQTLRPKDILTIDGTRYEVIDAPVLYDALAKHHTEAVLKRLN